MKIKLKIENSKIQPPEAWILQEKIQKLYPIDENHIISFADSEPLTLYKDDIWDLSPFGNFVNVKNKIFFTNIKEQNDRKLAKRLFFTMMFFTKGRNGLMKAPSSLVEFFNKGILYLHRYAYSNSLTMKEILEDNELLIHYIDFLEVEYPYIGMHISSLLSLLKNNLDSITGVDFNADIDIDRKISHFLKHAVTLNKQTECIPVQILINATTHRWEHIDRVKKVLPSLLKLIDLLLDEHGNYRSIESQKAQKFIKNGHKFISFKELCFSLELTSFFRFYGIEDRDLFRRYLGCLQITSKHLIHTFTGMRHDESLHLLINCYNDKGLKNPIITSVEKKSSKILQKHIFVTIKEMKEVIALNSKISMQIAKHRDLDLKNLPLMLNSRYLHSTNIKSPNISGKGKELPLNQNLITLSTKDMEEVLKVVDPFRNWDNDEFFQVGKPWHFNYHQYRRSMAVYGLGSGLVSSAALGRQFRHFFSATTAHYGNGSFVAKPIDGGEKIKSI